MVAKSDLKKQKNFIPVIVFPEIRYSFLKKFKILSRKKLALYLQTVLVSYVLP